MAVAGNGAITRVHKGPNLAFLGPNEFGIYGRKTLCGIAVGVAKAALACGARLDPFQISSDQALTGRVFAPKKRQNAAIVVNPAGFTHSGVALRDALRSE